MSLDISTFRIIHYVHFFLFPWFFVVSWSINDVRETEGETKMSVEKCVSFQRYFIICNQHDYLSLYYYYIYIFLINWCLGPDATALPQRVSRSVSTNARWQPLLIFVTKPTFCYFFFAFSPRFHLARSPTRCHRAPVAHLPFKQRHLFHAAGICTASHR